MAARRVSFALPPRFLPSVDLPCPPVTGPRGTPVLPSSPAVYGADADNSAGIFLEDAGADLGFEIGGAPALDERPQGRPLKEAGSVSRQTMSSDGAHPLVPPVVPARDLAGGDD